MSHVKAHIRNTIAAAIEGKERAAKPSTHTLANNALECMLETIMAALLRHKVVKLRGLGTLTVRTRRPKLVTDFSEGTRHYSNIGKSLKFKPSKDLRLK